MEHLQLAGVLEQAPAKYHDWLKALPDSNVREEFFARILQRGLIDAVLITVRQHVCIVLPYAEDELVSFVSRNEPNWFRNKSERSTSQSITESILNQTVLTPILLDACESDNDLRRLIGCQCLLAHDLSKETDALARIIHVLQGLLEDREAKTKIFACYMLWSLAPEKVSNNRGIVNQFVHHLNSDSDADSYIEAGRCILKYALCNNREKDFDKLLPQRQPRTKTNKHAGIARNLRNVEIPRRC